ncbi:MAG: anhydro-N-acetylmuramic acid kinase [Rhodospirillaceae bacterium]|nr:anhydro-N-acetylmuramic acid kinase [Rhodospirillaceae bacterium]|tara:strand:- start:4373 stop:5467 length:1095 start_codon:yes stop_codon:yes gene_type:complete
MLNNSKIYTAIGLMSGTSLDGVDAAIIKTDGKNLIDTGPAITLEYNKNFKSSLFSIMGNQNKTSKKVLDIEYKLTKYHIEVVRKLMYSNNLNSKDIDIIGFHGQTISHDPSKKFTLQIGNPIQLANKLGINVVSNMRTADIDAGGQGAPLVPIYHNKCFKKFDFPFIVLNIGGVSNVTWINSNNLLAFDTGPGNSIIDDWVRFSLGIQYDDSGNLAKKGRSITKLVQELLKNDFFHMPPPKSIDRDYFNYKLIPKNLSPEDGAATAVDLIARSIKKSEIFFPIKPSLCIVSGGGRKNASIMSCLSSSLSFPVKNIDTFGLRGDFIEAEAVAYLAVRRIINLPTTFPETTGCKIPTSGGVITQYK